MSYIFEALQRAEAERSGVELDARDLPTELLQIAESTRAPQTTKAGPAASASAPPPTEFEPERVGENAEVEPVDFPQFQPLPVSLSPESKLVSVTAKHSLAAEKFRLLAVRLRHLQQRRPLKQILITSAIPEEGKSMVAANLACALASRRQRKTLLLEADLRRPTLQREFGLGEVPGLSAYLQGTIDGIPPIYGLDSLGIWLLPAGEAPENPLELLQSASLADLMNKLSGWFDWVVIDTPPILPLADTSVWTRLADGILFVTRQGKTDREQLKRGLEAIESAKLIGALLNSAANAGRGGYYYHYGSPAVRQLAETSAK
jgi:capsular exopolysaccharide synthesis family protein